MKNTIDLFLNSTSEYYNKLTQFQLIVLCLLLIYIFTQYFNKTYGFVIILLAFLIYISETFVTFKRENISNDNTTTMNKLIKLQNIIDKHISNRIKKSQKNFNINIKSDINRYLFTKSRLDNLYIDSNIINFLYSITPLSNYNSFEFYKLCIGTNNILKLKNQIEEYYLQNNDYPINIAEMLEDSIMLKKNCINNIHNFIYSIPKSNMMYKYNESVLNRYIILISRNIDDIHKYYKNYNKKYGYNTSTKIITYNTTKPLDYNKDYIPILSKKQNSLIEFYN